MAGHSATGGAVVAICLSTALLACRESNQRAETHFSVNTSSIPHDHTNRLAGEKSPYLLQHQHNPVDWYPWNDEAFQKARQENKPIFLSIGYSTCHWCHVMERESFENPKIADFLNRHFVSIKVDREERPDVDKIYMTAVQAISGQGGWPLTAFLTPDLKPFYGGTYYPPENRHGRPGFLELLQQIAKLWETRRGDIDGSARDFHARLASFARQEPTEKIVLSKSMLQSAAATFKQEYDPAHGGFGGAPKFPRPTQPAFLLRYAAKAHDAEAVRMVLHTCDRMAAGGMYDQLGGGFSRYAVDATWLVPHFEKMLYDNAQLVHLYLDAHLVSGEARYAEVARDILRYVLRDMTHPEGGFYSAEDADSEGKEGKFYCWTQSELSQLLTAEESRVAIRYFGVTEKGNFLDHSDPNPLPNQNVLSVVDTNLNAQEVALLQAAREKMFRARSKRVRPHLDDKVLASWNGMMLGAVSRAYGVLQDPAYRAAAEKNLAFLQAKLWDPKSKTLYHRWRDGARDHVQLQDAYADLMAGVLEFYEATLDAKSLEFAVSLAETMLIHFYDAKEGGFYQSAEGASDLILRVKEDYDGAEPSGNSVAVMSLLKLSAITDRKDFREAAEKTLRLMAHRLQNLPQAVPYLLQALDFFLEEPKRAVLVGKPGDKNLQELLRAIHSVYQPNKVVLGTEGPVEPFAKKLPAKDAPNAFVCTGTACQPPTRDPAQIRSYLKTNVSAF